ncbi:MAG: MaoC family dehydratase [Actinomycetales bacterium]|nr:MaoC family dehydratase [Actinomycetales bacterium]
MRVFNGLDEVRGAVGQHLGVSDWHVITQEQVNLFADATGDHQWIHVDPERAAAGPFGAPIAHGFLTLSMVPMLLWQVFTIEGVTMMVNYGLNKVRFPAAATVGSRVRAAVSVASITDTPHGAQVVMSVTVEREGSDKPVCVAETITLIVP